MSDAETRALVRRAETSQDGDDWLRAAWALARARDWDEAGEAAARAQAAGSDAGGVLDSMAPPLDAFVARAVGEPHPRGLAHPVFAWSGRELFGLDRDRVVSIDLATGERHHVGEVPCAIDRWGKAEAGPLAPSPDGGSIAVAYRRPRGKWCVALVSPGSEATRHPLVLQGLEPVTALANTGAALSVCSAEGGSGRATHVSLNATALPTTRLATHKIKGIPVVPVLDRSGAAAELDLDGERVSLRRSLIAEPHGFAALGRSVGAGEDALALHAAGFRIVAARDSELRLFSPLGDCLASRRPALALERAAVSGPLSSRVHTSSSGRLVVVTWIGAGGRVRDLETDLWRRLDLLDISSNESRTLALEGSRTTTDFQLAWSPSGRKLAITSEGESPLLWQAPD